jgi:hypothetical protein
LLVVPGLQVTYLLLKVIVPFCQLVFKPCFELLLKCPLLIGELGLCGVKRSDALCERKPLALGIR